MAKLPTPQMLVASRPAFPDKSWLDTKPEFMPGSFCYPAKKETMELLHMPSGTPPPRTGTCRRIGKKFSVTPLPTGWRSTAR